MSENVKILAFAGSLRKNSHNKKLVNAAVPILKASGADVTHIDLRDFQLPMFDEDLEAEKGLPENGRKLKDLFIEHDGFFLSNPEYNGFFSGVFKNTIDWLSRPVEGFPPYECFEGKVAAITSASPGALGGIRSLQHVRQQLSNVKLLVIPDQLSISGAGTAFDSNGKLTDEKKHQALEAVCKQLVKVTAKLKKS